LPPIVPQPSLFATTSSADEDPSSREPWRPGADPPLAPLVAILVLALGLGVAASWQRPLLDDEVGTMVAVGESAARIVTTFDEWLTQPAYFLLVLPFTALLGPTELAVRLPALLAGLGGLVALAFLGARLLGPRVGLLAALLLALQPYPFFYSQMGRGYSLAAALSTTSALLLLALARGAGVRVGVAYVAARALGVYAHLGACGSGLAELAIVFAVARPVGSAVFRRTLGWMAAGAVVSALVYAPLLDDMVAFGARWTGEARGSWLRSLPLVLTAYAGGRGVSIFAWVALVVLGTTLAWRASRVAGLVLLLWPLGVFAFYAAAGTAHYPWAWARFLFPTLPAFALAISTALDGLASKLGGRSPGRRRAALVGSVLLFVLLTATKTPRIAFGARDADWPAVIERLEAAGVDPRQAFVLPLRFNAFAHYLTQHEGLSPGEIEATQLVPTLGDGGTAALADRRLAFLVDVATFDEARFDAHFEVERFGSTTLLLARPELDRSEAAAVAATRAVVERVVEELETLPRGPISSDWVYWRIDRRHEHAFVPDSDLIAAWALLGNLARAEGDTETFQRARARVAALKGELRRPSQVLASPSLLGLHWDLL